MFVTVVATAYTTGTWTPGLKWDKDVALYAWSAEVIESTR